MKLKMDTMKKGKIFDTLVRREFLTNNSVLCTSCHNSGYVDKIPKEKECSRYKLMREAINNLKEAEKMGGIELKTCGVDLIQCEDFIPNEIYQGYYLNPK